MRSLLISLLGLSITFMITEVHAQIFHYEDNEGRKHYVDSENKIPDEFKDKVKKGSDFPSISKVSGPDNYDKKDAVEELEVSPDKVKNKKTENKKKDLSKKITN